MNIVKKLKRIRKKEKRDLILHTFLNLWNIGIISLKMLGSFEQSYTLEVNTCNNNEEIIKVNYIIQSIMLNNKLKKKKKTKRAWNKKYSY